MRGRLFCFWRKHVGEVIRRHATALALAGYLAAALLTAVSALLLPLPRSALSVLFAVETLLLGAAGVWLWRLSIGRMSAMAFRDELTSLANRRAFNRQAETFGREERGGSRSLVLFDVDGLKDINENCGHQAGDELLSAVGQRLSDLDGAAFRIGGDEFAVLVDRGRGESAVPVLRRLEPFQTDFASCGHSHPVSLSYGFASAMPGEHFAALFRRADERLRQFKRDLYANGNMPERRIVPAMGSHLPEGPLPGKKSRGRLRLLG
jgi:diguanylate cyclase (GGDEF)-like protein